MTSSKLCCVLFLATIPAYACDGVHSSGDPSSYVNRSLGSPTIHRRLAIADFNGDGNGDWAIGVPDTPGCRSGQVHFWYERFTKDQPHEVWHPVTSGLVLANACDANFGAAVAAGDFNGDGYDDIAVGAPGDVISSRTNAGSVQVLYGTSLGLSPVDAQLFSQDSAGVDDDAESNDAFGTSVASGDFDCDGYADLAIGVPGERNGDVKNAGSVHILFGSTGGLTTSRSQLIQQAELMHDSYFGSFLAAGNIDGDTLGVNDCDDLAIGIPGMSPPPDPGHTSQPAAGVVSVLHGGRDGLGDGKLWHQEIRGVDGENRVDDEFGRGVWLIDENADGYWDLFAYAAGDDTMFLIRGSPEGLASSAGAGPVGQGAGRSLCVLLCNLAWQILPPGPVCDCSFCDVLRAPAPDPCPNCA